MASRVQGLDRYLARLKSIPAAVRAAVGKQVVSEALQMAEAMKRAAPVDSGALRGSIRVEPGSHELSVKVVAGGAATTRAVGNRTYESAVRLGSGDTAGRAKKAGGHHVTYDYAAGVEWGHVSADGKHVAAQPFFFPTYRARKKPLKRRLSAAARKAIKDLD